MQMTMAINPAFLQLRLLRQNSQQPLNGVTNTAKVTGDTTTEAMKNRLAMNEYGMLSRMNAAKIEEMANNLAIRRGELALGENRLGLDTQKLALGQTEQGWREKNWRKAYDTESDNLWQTTALGLGTGAYAAYEGNRRNTLLRQDAAYSRDTNAILSKLVQDYYSKRPPVQTPIGGRNEWYNYEPLKSDAGGL
jgi:hypothetical protein